MSSNVVQLLEKDSIFTEESAAEMANTREEEIESRNTAVATGPWGDVPMAMAGSDEITFTRTEITYLWDAGVFNDKTYVFMALKIEQQHFRTQHQNLATGSTHRMEIDYEAFAERWIGMENDKGKQKRLDPEKIDKQISSFYGKVVETPKSRTIEFYG